jgi:hypothetical protein
MVGNHKDAHFTAPLCRDRVLKQVHAPQHFTSASNGRAAHRSAVLLTDDITVPRRSDDGMAKRWNTSKGAPGVP